MQAELAQQAVAHTAHSEAQKEEVQSLRGQLAELKQKQAMKQHPWAGRLPGMFPTCTHASLYSTLSLPCCTCKGHARLSAIAMHCNYGPTLRVLK